MRLPESQEAYCAGCRSIAVGGGGSNAILGIRVRCLSRSASISSDVAPKIDEARSRLPNGDLNALLRQGHTWRVEA